MKVMFTPFECCGMVGGSGFTGNKAEFNALLEQQDEENAACAMIVLADNQPEAIKQANAAGFTTIYSFLNYKSGSMCYVMVHMRSDPNEM